MTRIVKGKTKKKKFAVNLSEWSIDGWDLDLIDAFKFELDADMECVNIVPNDEKLERALKKMLTEVLEAFLAGGGDGVCPLQINDRGIIINKDLAEELKCSVEIPFEKIVIQMFDNDWRKTLSGWRARLDELEKEIEKEIADDDETIHPSAV